MGSCDAAASSDRWSDLICPWSGANPDFAISKSPQHHNRAFSMLYSWFDTWGCSSFTTYRPSYLTQRFWTLIHQSKGLYSTSLLFSLWAYWFTGAIWHCFVSSKVVSQQQFCHRGQLHKNLLLQWILADFFFMTLVQLCSDIWSG